MFTSSRWLSALPLAAQAIRIPFHSVSRPQSNFHTQSLLADTPGTCSDQTCGQLANTLDVVYFSNITVGGEDFLVQLDTGSSDLWVNASVQPVRDAAILQTVIVSNVYGDGSNYTGPVAFADVQFHGFEVKNQSFTYALQSENDNTASLNLTGLIGLSFDSISNNDQAVTKATGSKTLGQTFLSNVFQSNSSLDPFISFILSREADLNSTANEDGAFTIAEIEQGYEAIENEKAVPLFPQGSIQWTVAVDSISVNGQNLQFSSSVKDASSPVALLDTGTSVLLVPDQLARSIYSSIQGVTSFSQSGQTTYIVPCDQEPPKLVITIGGSPINIHPLDSNTIFQTFQTSNGNLISVCSGGIVGYSANSNFGGSGFDLLLGDTFLRNAYTMFNFGSGNSSSSSSSSGPFIKILGTTDPSQASSDFTSTRQKQLSLAPAASASQINDLLNGNGVYTPVDTPLLNPSGSNGSGNGNGNGNGQGGGNNTGAAVSISSSFLFTALSILCGVMLS